MTVEELIQKLSKMDPRKNVYIDDEEYGPTNIGSVEEQSSLVDKFPDVLKPISAVWLTLGSSVL